MPIQPQVILDDLTKTGDLTALDETVILDINGISGGKAVVSGTWVGTVKFEGSVDGSRWDAIGTFSGTTGAILSTTGTTVNDALVFVGIAGLRQIRARMHAYTSGTATVTIRSSNGVSNVFVDNLLPTNLRTQIHGSANGPTTPIQTDAAGYLKTQLRDDNNVSITVGQKVMSNSLPVVLASDQYTADTTPLYVEDFDSKLVDLSKSFIVTTNNLSKGTTESPAFLIRNPSGSGKNIYLNVLTFAGTGTFRIYFSPTITTVGTALTPLNKKIVSGTQSNSGLTYFNPTTSANGSLAFLYNPTAQTGTEIIEFKSPILIQPGIDILITTLMGANGTITNISAQWTEV